MHVKIGNSCIEISLAFLKGRLQLTERLKGDRLIANIRLIFSFLMCMQFILIITSTKGSEVNENKYSYHI